MDPKEANASAMHLVARYRTHRTNFGRSSVQDASAGASTPLGLAYYEAVPDPLPAQLPTEGCFLDEFAEQGFCRRKVIHFQHCGIEFPLFGPA